LPLIRATARLKNHIAITESGVFHFYEEKRLSIGDRRQALETWNMKLETGLWPIESPTPHP
jgi:hypothetical protein